MVLLELDHAKDARNAFARAVENAPEYAEAHYNLSFVLSSLGEYDAALRSVTRAQTIDLRLVTDVAMHRRQSGSDEAVGLRRQLFNVCVQLAQGNVSAFL